MRGTQYLRSLPSTISTLLRTGPTPPAPASASTPPPIAPSSSEAAETSLNGWIRSIRVHKNVAFAEIDDGTARVQAVLKGSRKADGIGTGVSLSGGLEKSKGKGQDVEFVVDHTRILGVCDPNTYPIQKKHLPPAFLRDHAHLRFRTVQTAAVMRVMDKLMREWHDWFEENEFTHIHTPLLTSSDCEGAGETFQLVNPVVSHPTSAGSTPSAALSVPPNFSVSTSVPISPTTALKSASTSASSVSSASLSPQTSPTSQAPSQSRETFFPTPVNLTVSSQLHLECPTHSLSRVYTLSPAFRAEPSQTSRHLCEFYMLEAEVAFVETLDQLLDVVEKGIREVLHQIMWDQGNRAVSTRDDLQIIRDHSTEGEGDTEGVVEGEDRPLLSHLINASARPFTRITYTDAITLLESLERDNTELQFEHPPVWGNGLSTEHERFLAAHFGGPVFVTHYPKALKPFYMLPSTADPSWHNHGDQQETVACFDLLLPGLGELIGGSLREHRLAPLLSSIQKAGLRREEYEWYLDLRRYGSVPHGGWGMGWERWICWVTGVGNIRDVVAFPRWKGNCKY